MPPNTAASQHLVSSVCNPSWLPIVLLDVTSQLVSVWCWHPIRRFVNTPFSAAAPFLQEFPWHHLFDADLHQRGGLYHRHLGAPQRDVHPERGVHRPSYCQGMKVCCKSFVPICRSLSCLTLNFIRFPNRKLHRLATQKVILSFYTCSLLLIKNLFSRFFIPAWVHRNYICTSNQTTLLKRNISSYCSSFYSCEW